MMAIVAGTNRKESNSLKIARCYHSLVARSTEEVQLVDLGQLPADFTASALYENAGKNASFNLLRNQITSASRLVFVIPEYNGSFPGVLKAFVDGLSYPHLLQGKRAALVGHSAGELGGIVALNHFADVLHSLGSEVLSYKIRLPAVQHYLRGETLSDERYLKMFHTQIEKLRHF